MNRRVGIPTSRTGDEGCAPVAENSKLGPARQPRQSFGSRSHGAPGDHRGAAAVELALLVPVVVLVAALLVAGARVWSARASVNEAAGSAARAASLQRTSTTAASAAHEAVRSSLAGDGLSCSQQSVQLDLAGVSAAAGTAARIRVEVHCRVQLADLVQWGIPGSLDAHGSAVQPVDTFRAREGGG